MSAGLKTPKIGYRIGKQNVPSGSLAPKSHDSECVASLSYDVENQQATCHFHERGSYVYFDIEPDVFMEWNNAGSRGQYLNLYIKGKYSYEKI